MVQAWRGGRLVRQSGTITHFGCGLSDFLLGDGGDQAIARGEDVPKGEPEDTEVNEDAPHLSHVTRISDASSFDEICINCGATDNPLGLRGDGRWGELAKPCSKAAEVQ